METDTACRTWGNYPIGSIPFEAVVVPFGVVGVVVVVVEFELPIVYLLVIWLQRMKRLWPALVDWQVLLLVLLLVLLVVALFV